MATNGSFPQSLELILFAAFGEGVLDVGQWQKRLFSSGENSLLSYFDSHVACLNVYQVSTLSAHLVVDMSVCNTI